MQVRRAVVGLAIAGLALALGGCGSDGASGRASATKSAAVGGFDSGGDFGGFVEEDFGGFMEAPELIPDRVAVHRPAFIDTNISPNDVPVWPGPDPYEFLKPSPPSGLSGEIAGERAGAVYAAALDNPDAVWNVGGTVQWLVVEALP